MLCNNNLLLLCSTFSQPGGKSVGAFLLMLLMLELSVFVYYQMFTEVLYIQKYRLWTCKHKVALKLLWWFNTFQNSAYDQ